MTDQSIDAIAASLREALHVPTSTYRVQLSHLFTFADLSGVVPYLDALGVGACYLSPCLKARPGSLHGYDVVDHRELNPELGTRAQIETVLRDIRSRGMGTLLDMVPNHMAVDPVHNLYWRDVLQNGPGAASAEWFDIDWHPVKESLRDRVLLPILGDQYGVVLERGELQLALQQGEIVVRYFDSVLPFDSALVPVALEPEVSALKADPSVDERDLRDVLSVMTALANLPGATERGHLRREERRRESEVACERFETLLARAPAVRDAVERGLARLNGTPGVPASFDALHEVLERQSYRVAYWRTAFDEINYRRFFDINDLGAVRMEDPKVFAEAHRLILDLVRDGLVTGLRLDHPDGLYDPDEYFEHLQSAAWRSYAEASVGTDRPDLVEALVHWRERRRDDDRAHWSVRPLFLVAEKIVLAGEAFREGWAIHGGTGYRFLNLVNGLFIDRVGLHQLERVWARLSGQHETFDEIAYDSRRLIAQTAMASEMNVLAHALEELATRDRRSRDYTLNSLRRVLREVVASFPVYRTYVTGRGVSDADRFAIGQAIVAARRHSPVMEASIFEFIERALTGTAVGSKDPTLQDAFRSGGSLDPTAVPTLDPPIDPAPLRFAMRFQQITGPIQAKGIEDTAFYRYAPLLATNEVGSNPSAPTTSVEQFHAANAARLIHWPATLLTLATHDTKRGSDARARLTVVSDRAQEWRRAVAQWMRINARHRQSVGDVPAPDRADEYLFYQALVAIWPPELESAPLPAVAPAGLETRVGEYMVKAIREAKMRSSWLRPDHAYEDAVTAFVHAVMRGTGAARFLARFVPFARTIARLGAVNSLAQTTLMHGVPGVPDIYQGAELWHLCLVDPDNRQPVDFAARQAMLAELEADLGRAATGPLQPADQPLPIAVELAANWIDGRVKLWVTAATLRHRRQDAELLLRGDYVPLLPSAPDTPVVAFARRAGTRALIVIVPHHAGRLSSGRGWPTGEAWADRTLALPDDLAHRSWRDLLTGRAISTGGGALELSLAQVLDPLPVAWLVG